jgi:hypothetical protein
MKKCPVCGFENDAELPTCAFCNSSIADVRDQPSKNPNLREFDLTENRAMRRRILRNRLLFACVCYVAAITLTALFPGGVLRAEILALYGASALFVAFANFRDWLGQSTIAFLQGIASLALLLKFGPLQPFIFFMLAVHAMLASLYWHWTNLLYDAQR